MGRHSVAGKRIASDDQPESHPRFLRRHRKVFIAAICLILLPVLAFSAYLLYLNGSLKNIDRIVIDRGNAERSKDDPGESILLMGVDQGSRFPEGTAGFDIAADSRRAVWPVDKYHSDTMMIVHVSKDHRKISIISIPRDSYIDIYDAAGEKTEKNRVNTALTKFGPSAAVTTIEKFADVRIDHLAMVDFESFKAITDALGGVTVHIPETVYAKDSNAVAWQQGDMKLDGPNALRYVRDRKNLTNSDYGRVRRQQNFMRATLTKLSSKGTLSNPGRLKGTLDAVTKNLSVDDGWSASNIRGLAFAMRNISGSNIQFVTLPIDGYSKMVKDIGSVVKPDKDKAAELFKAVKANNVDEFVAKYPKLQLEEESKVR